MDMMVVKIVGVVVLSLVFALTVLLMPRIFGVNDPSATADEAAGARAGEAPLTYTPAARRANWRFKTFTRAR